MGVGVQGERGGSRSSRREGWEYLRCFYFGFVLLLLEYVHVGRLETS